MSERRRAKQQRRAHRKANADPLTFDSAWTWRQANNVAAKLRTGAIVVYPVAADQRERRLQRFEPVIAELERIGLVFDVQLAVDGDELAIVLVPRDCERAA